MLQQKKKKGTYAAAMLPTQQCSAFWNRVGLAAAENLNCGVAWDAVLVGKLLVSRRVYSAEMQRCI